MVPLCLPERKNLRGVAKFPVGFPCVFVALVVTGSKPSLPLVDLYFSHATTFHIELFLAWPLRNTEKRKKKHLVPPCLP
jgi:hypothetical protein